MTRLATPMFAIRACAARGSYYYSLEVGTS